MSCKKMSRHELFYNALKKHKKIALENPTNKTNYVGRNYQGGQYG